jgi:hypothetical protein
VIISNNQFNFFYGGEKHSLPTDVSYL